MELSPWERAECMPCVLIRNAVRGNEAERIKTDLKAFEFGLIRFYPLHPLFPCSIKVLFGSGSSGLGIICAIFLPKMFNNILLIKNQHVTRNNAFWRLRGLH